MRSKSLRKGLVILIVFAMLFAMGVVNLSTAQALPGSEGTAFSSANEKIDVLIGFYQAPGSSERALVRSHGGEISRQFNIVDVIAASMTQQTADVLAENPKVRYVELDRPVYALDQTVPWGIERVFGDETYSFDTWDITKGDGIGVAVIDTGIDINHEDLVVVNGVRFRTTGPFLRQDDNYDDDNGHGTHVAGTVAALDNDLGVVGVGPKIDLYAVKVLDASGSGSVSSVVAGIEWSVEQNIPILNMSLGSGSDSTTLRDTCDKADSEGHLLVASAGNSGNLDGTGDNVGYPAKYDSVIAVAASDDNDKRASFSSTGPAVDLIAPGSNILSTTPGNEYGTKSGTSMASPHVAGVAALVLAADPGLTPAEIRGILQETAEDLGLSANHQGYGLVRADLAVRAAAGVTPPVTYTITATAGEGGTIDPLGDVTVNEGDSQTFIITPASGYKTSDVKIDNESVGAVESYTFENVRADHAIYATFEAVPTYIVSGTVEDTEGNLLDGATVTIKETGQSATTDSDGKYSISDVEDGTYYITASKDGYSSQTTNTSVVSNTILDFILEETEDASGLTIDHFELTDTSNRAWARVEVEWAVSEGDGNLEKVTSEMWLLNEEGNQVEKVDSETSTVSGNTASGIHVLRFRGGRGETYQVKLTVTDTDGNSTYKTEDIEL